MHKFTSMLLATTLLLSVGSAATHASVVYTLTDLGNRTQMRVSPVAINAKGQVVGGIFTGEYISYPFLYDNGVLTDLGRVDGDNYTQGNEYWINYGFGINDNGQIVGSIDAIPNQGHAFLYSNDVMMDLGPFTQTGVYTSANSINASGQIVGTGLLTSVHPRAFILNNGVLKEVTSAGWTLTSATGINNQGQIVGGGEVSSSITHAYVDSNNVITDLGTLGGSYSSATAINNSGQIVGSTGTDFRNCEAFVYSNGSMNYLSAVRDPFSIANAINESGTIVGSQRAAGATAAAFIYRDGTMQNLNTLIDPAVGWTLTNATAINASGQILATDVRERGCLLTPNVTIATAPATAPHLVATPATNGQIYLTWGPIAGAESYSVFRGTAAGQLHTYIGTVSNATMFTDTHPQYGTQYYYIVTAVNSHGTGPKSNESTASVADAGPITNLAATVYGAHKIGLTWTPGLNSTAYDVFRSDTPTSSRTYIGTAYHAGFIVGGLPPSTTYYYTVVPKNYATLASGGSLTVSGTTSAISIASIKFNPFEASSGTSITGTLSLSSPAPASNAVVQLTSSDPAALSVPATAQMTSGTTSRSFIASMRLVTNRTPVTVTATYGGICKTVVIVNSVPATAMSSVSFSPSSIIGVGNLTGTLVLNGVAPASNAVVQLTSSNPGALFVPATAQISSGQFSRTFTAVSRTVTVPTNVTVTATWGGVSQTTVVTVNPVTLGSVTFSPSTVTSGTNLTGTLTLTGPAPPSNAVVSLSSSNPAALYVPPTAQLNSGLSSRTFTAVARSVVTSTSVTVTASYGGVSKTTIVSVNP